ncbi:hypothetical protein RhiirA4_470159 [Rhizophagus irregularis]|uniref:Reverse transcriptase domain-containing protein n=1 Tax=Rhizophagus irregularis TaxID=588596 RepID=A0A2I1H0V6_9GLOM|nr:hypothetical protein RhiirA4_470159 [Rhizophagus irregularis]
MDDTAFIETSKEIMQELLNIAKSFYNMMVIVINVKKCNLIVINSSLPEEDNKVYLGNSADDSVSATKGDVRYLGVWIAGKKARNLNKQRIVELNFYTDGSLKKSVYNSIQDRNAQINEKWNPDTVEVIQGAAFIETSTEESMQVRIDNWPSSTRAELYAILLAPYQQYS